MEKYLIFGNGQQKVRSLSFAGQLGSCLRCCSPTKISEAVPELVPMVVGAERKTGRFSPLREPLLQCPSFLAK